MQVKSSVHIINKTLVFYVKSSMNSRPQLPLYYNTDSSLIIKSRHIYKHYPNAGKEKKNKDNHKKKKGFL